MITLLWQTRALTLGSAVSGTSALFTEANNQRAEREAGTDQSRKHLGSNEFMFFYVILLGNKDFQGKHLGKEQTEYG